MEARNTSTARHDTGAAAPLAFFDFFEGVPLGVFLVDRLGRVVECNDRFLAMAGAPRERVIGFNLLENSRDPALIPYLRRALAGEAVDFETPYTSTTGGRSSHYHYRFAPAPANVAGVALTCFAQDISALKSVEAMVEALRLSEEKFAKAFRDNPDPMIISAIDNGLTHEVNSGFTSAFGYTAEEMVGRTTLEVGLWADPAQRERTVALMREHGCLRDHEVDFFSKDGRRLTVLGTATRLDIDGRAFWLVQFRDVTERKRLLADLERAAHFDELSGLPNRRHFMRNAEQEFQRAARYGRPLSLLMLDLDHFKAINDRHGHRAGDAVLRAVGACLAGELREHDAIGRIGGEEFALVLPETGRDAACEVAERIRGRVAALAPALPDGGAQTVTVSIGVAVAGAGERGVDALLSRADDALYRAKDRGRDRWCLADD